MRVSREILRRAARVTATVLAVAGMLPSGGRASEDAAAPTLQAAILAWRDSLRSWSTYTEEHRRAKSIDFMRHYDDFDVATMCRECAKSTRLGVDGAAFLRARFSLLSPGPTELLRMLRDPSLGLPCHGTIEETIFRKRAGYSSAEKDSLASAMLTLAERANYAAEVRRNLEWGAADLSRSDRVYERMDRRIRSDDPQDRETGVGMAVNSGDPRAVTLLTQHLDRVKAEGGLPDAPLLSTYAVKMGRSAYDRIRFFYERSGDGDYRAKALLALCRTKDPRAMSDLIDAYQDTETGIRDSTSMLKDPHEGGRFYQLWSCAAVLDSTIAASLLGNDSVRAASALEIVDRASRFGPWAGSSENVAAALLDFAKKPGRDAALARRAEGIVDRLRAGTRARPSGGAWR
jgi:hypothetical protein